MLSISLGMRGVEDVEENLGREGICAKWSRMWLYTELSRHWGEFNGGTENAGNHEPTGCL